MAAPGRDHTCKTCSKTYTKAEHLIRHERVHTGAKPYACKICTKAFARTDSLSRHAKVHLNGKVRKRRSTANTNATNVSDISANQSHVEQHEPAVAANETSSTPLQITKASLRVAHDQPLIDPMLMQQEVSHIDPMLNQDINQYQHPSEQHHHEQNVHQQHAAQYQWPASYHAYAPPHNQQNMFMYYPEGHAPQMMTAEQHQYASNGYEGIQHLQAQDFVGPK